MLLDDGRIETTVERVEDETVSATVENGGELAARKGVNVPGVELDLPTITENDEHELDVAAEKEPDFVAASFVRAARISTRSATHSETAASTFRHRQD